MLHAGDVMQKYFHELSPDKMRLDQLYVRYRSFWLDLDVILCRIVIIQLFTSFRFENADADMAGADGSIF